MTHELWARFILLLGAAVVAPWGLRAANQRTPVVGPLRWACVGLLGLAQLFSPGPIALALSLPWFLVTCAVAVAGLRSGWQHRRGPVSELACAGGMIYLAIGGGWALADRAGFRPLEFDPAIVLLTGVHFHFAGFALPILAGLAIRRDPPRISAAWERGIVIAVVASVPVVAVGITATQLGYSPLVELLAAWSMSLAGLGVALLYLRLAFEPNTPPVARHVWSLGALFLATGMCLSILYGSRSLVPLSWLDIPTMRATHGTLNALGFVIPALLGWRWCTTE